MRISDWSSDVCSSDLAFCERFENAGCEACQAQTPFDETDCEAEAARHFFDRGTRVDDRCEGLRLIGRVHRETLEVLGEAGFAHFAFLAFNDKARDRKSTRLNSSH